MTPLRREFRYSGPKEGTRHQVGEQEKGNANSSCVHFRIASVVCVTYGFFTGKKDRRREIEADRVE